MERQFITPPPTEMYESCEERYNTIIEYLQECVDEGIMLFEDANDIANSAYDKYIVEARAADKWLEKRRKEFDKRRDKIESMDIPESEKKELKRQLYQDELQYEGIVPTGGNISYSVSPKWKSKFRRGENPYFQRNNSKTIYTRYTGTGRDRTLKSGDTEPVKPREPGLYSEILQNKIERQKEKKWKEAIKGKDPFGPLIRKRK